MKNPKISPEQYVSDFFLIYRILELNIGTKSFRNYIPVLTLYKISKQCFFYRELSIQYTLESYSNHLFACVKEQLTV